MKLSRRIRWALALAVCISFSRVGVAASEVQDVLPSLPEGQSWKLIWADEFEGTILDAAKWEALGDSKRRDGFWVKEDSYVDGQGHLLRRTKQDGDRYTSGAIRTRGKFEHTYGYWVARCKLPKEPGHWPAFWLMCDGVGKVGNEGRDGTEIDIVEVPWRNGQITMNAHWDGYGKDHKSDGKKVTLPELTDGFHTFALWWKTNEYVFYTDGRETWRTSAGGVSQVPEFIKLTEEIGKWGGEIEKAKLPDVFVVDYARVYAVSRPENAAAESSAVMEAGKDPASGQVTLSEGGKPILRYNYGTVAPGEKLSQISSNNLKYARARSDYIHPLYGLDGEELTRDWPVDHPHHRGIYWAWPEVRFGEELGDLHALQRIFARPTGQCTWEGGSEFAQVNAENLWLWEDREPIVRERAIIRAHRQTERGRCINLEFHVTALQDNVTIARRGTDQYGGLNMRFGSVSDQRITVHTGSADSEFPMAWAELSGRWGKRGESLGVLVLQHTGNPDYPGDWIQFPELNWVQPTFPAARSRYALKKDEPLVLRYRLWIQRDAIRTEQGNAELWEQFNEEQEP